MTMRHVVTLVLAAFCPALLLGQIYRLDERNFPSVRVWYFPRESAQLSPPSRVDDSSIPVQIAEHTCERVAAAVPADIALCVDVSSSNSVWRENRALLDTIAATFARELRSSDVRFFLVPFANSATAQPPTDAAQLPDAVRTLQFGGGTNYAAAFDAAAVAFGKSASRQRLVIVVTDGLDTLDLARVRLRFGSALPHVIAVMLRNEAPPVLRSLALESDGGWFELISSPDAAAQAADHIARLVRGEATLCSIRYDALATCTALHEVQLHFPRSTYGIRYRAPRTAKLEITTSHVYFGVPLLGTTRDATVTLTARGLPVRLDTAWISGSPGFSLAAPVRMLLGADNSATLTVRYRARDTSAAWGELHIATSCGEQVVTFSVGRRSAQVQPSLFRIINPRGGERYWSGSDVPIAWLGIPPDDSCRIALSYDDGRSWQTIADAASNLRWRWKVPLIDAPRRVSIQLERIGSSSRQTAQLDKPITIEPTSGVITPADLGQAAVGIRKDTVLRSYIHNRSTSDPLTIERIEFTGEAASDFGIASGVFPAKIPPGGTLDVELFFRPSARGRRTAELLLVSPSGYVRQVIWGHGIGATPLHTIVDFGSVEIGTLRQANIPYTPSTTDRSTIEWSGDSSAFRITLGATSNLEIAFQPDSVRFFHATARITDPMTPLTLELNGRGIPPSQLQQDPTRFRTLALPTAEPLNAGTVGIGSYDGISLLGLYAPTERVALFAGGLLPIRFGEQRFYAYGIGARLAHQLSERWSIAGGGAIAFTRAETHADTTQITLAAPFLLATVQLGNVRLNGGVGYAFKEHRTSRDRYRADVPVLALGGDVQFAPQWKVALDIFHAGTVSSVPIAASVRYFGQQLALDGGIMLAFPTQPQERFVALPVVSAFWIFR